MAEEFGYEKLEVWQIAMQIDEGAFHLSFKLAPEHRFDVASQMRRCALSIPSNIAEGYGRETSNSFANFARIAKGSLFELRTIISLAVNAKLLPEDELNNLRQQVVLLSKKLDAFIRSLEKNTVREEPAGYGVALSAPQTADRKPQTTTKE